jgi:peptidoglycan/LPS O-acetylase OafA/YrhL
MKDGILHLLSPQSSENNFLITKFRNENVGINFIRFILAFFVLLSHSWPLSGLGNDPTFVYKNLELTLGTFAVTLFFAISGYLVGFSAITRNPSDFIQSRILRIFPAYIFCLFVSAFVLGTIIHLSSGESLKSYFNFNQNGPFAYFMHNLVLPMDITYNINNIFGSNPYNFAINGSLWTLPLEFRLYLLLLLLILIGKSIKLHFALMFFIGYLFLYFIADNMEIEILKVIYSSFIVDNINLISVFFLSAAIAVYGNRFRINNYIVVIALPFIFWFNFYIEIIGIVLMMTLLPKLSEILKLSRIGFFKNDISYGLYIFAFPTQQAVIYFLPNLKLIEFIFLSLLFSSILSLFSWKFIESPILKIKKNRLSKLSEV